MDSATPILEMTRPSRDQVDSACPLILDIDETLLRPGFLIETAIAYVKPNPFRLFHVLWWLLDSLRTRVRGGVTRELASNAEPNYDTLPLNAELVQLAKAATKQGRPVYLATASDATMTLQLARHFPFLTGVIGSDHGPNLSGEARAAALARRFPDGFDYAGYACADLAVCRKARTATLVPTTPLPQQNAYAIRSLTEYFKTPAGVRELLRGLRSHHWAKNLLVFVPILLAGQFLNWTALSNTMLAFVAIGLVASATYLINDMFDLADDRRHWSKRYRPIASGRLPIEIAAIVAPFGICLGLLTGLLASVGVVSFLAVYLLITLAYSFGLKRIPLVDGLVLATLFTTRIAIGIVAADVRPSPWLLVFSMFLFGSLGYAKRYTEITRATIQGNNVVHARGYRSADAPLLLVLGVGAGLGAVLIMILYIAHDAFPQTFYGNTIGLWLLPPLLFLLVARIWFVCQRYEMNDDPVDFALKDRSSLTLVAIMAVSFGFAWLGPHLN